jgi:hypothetical protein
VGPQPALEVVCGSVDAGAAAPCIGQHSAEVLAEQLGIGQDEYEKLVASGVTGTLDDVAVRL